MAADPDLRILWPPSGHARAIFVVCVACGSISLVTVLLRNFVRFRDQAFGWDDGLMLAGAIVFMVEVSLGAYGALVGLGYRNADLNAFFLVESVKYLMIWMLHYVLGLLLVKTSICVTMMRICGVHDRYRMAVYGILAVTVGNFIVTFVGILLLCRPVEANWDTSLVTEGKAQCSSTSAMIGLSYTSTAVSIATDMACAVLPGFILWNAQMAKKTKIAKKTKMAMYVLLCLGSTASISTIIRTPYINAYTDPTNDLVFYVGNIVLWSVVETAIGLVAGSLPSLRRLIKRKLSHNKAGREPQDDIPDQAYHKDGAGGAPSLLTFGSAPMRTPGSGRAFRNPTDLGVSRATVQAHSPSQVGLGEWQPLGDESDGQSASAGSDGEKNVRGNGNPAYRIMTKTTFAVELTELGDEYGKDGKKGRGPSWMGNMATGRSSPSVGRDLP